MRRALIVVVALLAASCAKGDTGPPVTTTTSSTSTTVASTTTTAASLAPNGCDASQLHRVAPRDDRTAYNVDATLDLDANTVSGTLNASFTPDKATDQLVVRLWPNGPTPAAHGAHEELSNATVDGRAVTMSLANPTTAYVNSGDLVANKRIEFAVAFTLRLPGASDDRLSRTGTTVRLGSWLPLLSWEPGVAWTLDPPTSADAEASTSIAADFVVHLVTPPGLTVLGTGTNVGGAWKAVAVPDWAASIGDFNVVTGSAGAVPVTVGVDKTIDESPNTYLTRVVSSITDLARRYGAYPWPAYTLAITPALKGGIEYPGHVMQGPGTNARTTPHEAAHQWFYALVGNDQGRDPWLDEGLASWAEAQVNHTHASFISKPIPAEGHGHMGEPMTFWNQRQAIYYRSVYVQTVQALGALGVSTAAVDCALARYVAANAYRVATPKDLIAALTTVAPNAATVLQGFGA